MQKHGFFSQVRSGETQEMNSQTTTFAGTRTQAVSFKGLAAPFQLKVFADPAEIEQEWRQLEATGIATIFQRFDWVDAYVRNVLPHEGARPAIVLGRLHGLPAFVLPLAVSRLGPVRIATWIGGKHSGYNFGLWSREAASIMACQGRAAIEAMLGQVLEGVDCAVLGRMPKNHDGVAQPVAALLSDRSCMEGYSFDLREGFEAVLERSTGARRRRVNKKERKMSKVGDLQYQALRDPARAKAALDFFLEQKTLRLAEQAEPNSFVEPGVRALLHDLLERSLTMREPLLEMSELSVAGKPRAVAGYGTHRGRVNVYFMTFTRDEITPYSPGRVLTYRHVEDCCDRGMVAYDLGVGYEDYKAHWCDVIHELNDAYVAVTPTGAAAVAAIRLYQAAKNRIRRNESLWHRLKAVRGYLPRLGWT